MLAFNQSGGSFPESMERWKLFLKAGAGIFFGCLRGRYKAPVSKANAYIFSQFEQKNSQWEGHFYVRPKWNICVVPVAYQQNLG